MVWRFPAERCSSAIVPPPGAAVVAALAVGFVISGILSAGEVGKVVEVVDGDTLRVRLPGRVETLSLIGVDAPELAGGPDRGKYLGGEAARLASDLVADQIVRLEPDPAVANRDAGGRLQRYVFLEDGRLLNSELIARGLGYADTSGSFELASEFRRLERQARRQQTGVWDSRRWQRQRAAESTGPHFVPTATVAPRPAAKLGLAAYARRHPFPDWELRRRQFEESLEKLGQPPSDRPGALLSREECCESCRRNEACADHGGQP